MPTITIRVDDEMRDKLNYAAEERGVTASTFAREALEEIIDMEERVVERRSGTTVYNLTPVERCILVMMHRAVLAGKGDLGDEAYDAEGERRAVDALENGFITEYSVQEFAGICDPMKQSEGELVWDILDMFRVINDSVKKLGAAGWGQLELKNARFYGSFQGFDGNDEKESKMLSYVTYLVESGRWTEQRETVLGDTGDRGNSHTTMLPTSRNMLREFKPRWRSALRGFGQHLSAEQIREVLIAAGAKEAEGDS